MKKWITACIVCLALLPGLLAQPAYAQSSVVMEQAVFVVEILPDGSQQVTQSMDVTLPEHSTGFAWKLYADTNPNGYEIRGMRASGDLAATVDATDYSTEVTFGNGAAQGTHRVVLEYTLVPRDDLDPDADYVLFDFLGPNWDFEIRALEARIHWPQGAVPLQVSLTQGLQTQLPAPGFTLQPAAEGLLLQSTAPLEPYEDVTLQASFPQGTFAYAPALPGNLVHESRCNVVVGSDMVYTVTQSVTLETFSNHEWLELPILEFEDYSVRSTAQLVSSSQPLEVYTGNGAWDSGLNLYFAPETAGVYTVEYTYTLRPVRLNTPLALTLRTPYWAKSTQALSMELSGPGFGTPVVALRNSILRTPPQQRFSLEPNGTQQGDSAVLLALTRPLYPGEELVLKIPYDAALYRRGASPQALGCVVFAAVVLLLVLAGRFLFGLGRPLQPVPQAGPPQGISCAEFGYLLDGVLTNREMAALVLQWAAEGALALEESGGEYIFTCTGVPAGTQAWEQQLFKAMFACGQNGCVTTVQLRGRFAQPVSRARTGLLAGYTGRHALAPLSGAKFLCMVLSLLPTAALGVTGALALGAGTAASLLAGGLGGLLAQGCLAILCGFAFAPHTGARRRGKAGRGLQTVFRAALAATLVLFAVLGRLLLPETPLWVIGAVLALASAAGVTCAGFMGRSAQTHALLCRVLGFAAFLQSESQDDFCTNQQSDAMYYYKMLPYALVMDQTDTWLASFISLDVPAPVFWKQCPNVTVCTRQAQHLVEVLRTASLPGAW